MRDFVYKHKKKILIGGVVVFLIILGVGIYNIINNNLNSATVNITVSPLIAKVRIGEKEYTSTESFSIRPGTYDVEIYADGFITKTGELVAVADEKVEISVVLEPTEENSDWYTSNPWDATAAGDIIDYNDLQDFYALQDKNAVLEYVPYNTFTYYIGYEDWCDENGSGICLVVSADFGVRRYALEYLQSKNLDLSLYYIKGKGYNLPFKKLDIEIPDGLEFSGEDVDLAVESEALNAINGLVNDYIGKTFVSDKYSANIRQIKKYDSTYYGVVLAVCEGEYSVSIYDSYRMLVGKVNDEWMVLTNADVVLSRYNNPNIPVELLKLFNNF